MRILVSSCILSCALAACGDNSSDKRANELSNPPASGSIDEKIASSEATEVSSATDTDQIILMETMSWQESLEDLPPALVEVLSEAYEAARLGPEKKTLRIYEHDWNIKQAVIVKEANTLSISGQISHHIPSFVDDQIYYEFRWVGGELKNSDVYVVKPGINEFLSDVVLSVANYLGQPIDRVQVEAIFGAIDSIRANGWEEAGEKLVWRLAMMLSQDVMGSQEDLRSPEGVITELEKASSAALFGPEVKRVFLYGHHWNVKQANIVETENQTIISGVLSHNVANALDDQVSYKVLFEGDALVDYTVEIKRSNNVLILSNIAQFVAVYFNFPLPRGLFEDVVTAIEDVKNGDWNTAAEKVALRVSLDIFKQKKAL